MKPVIFAGLILLSLSTYAQKGQQISWQKVKEADILWSKLVWRRIDLIDNENAPLRDSFARIILANIQNGSLKAYRSDEDFTHPLSPDSLHL